MKHFIIFFLLLTTTLFAQKSALTLDSCVKLARLNYPLLKQNGLIEQMEQNDQKGLNHNRFPKLSFHADATYQSEVTSFDLPGLGAFANIFPAFPKDNYAATLSLEQTIYDAGMVKEQKRVEKLNAENEHQKNEIEVYKLLDRVNQLYSNILLSRANLQALTIYKNDISNKETLLSASLNNGLALQSNLDELQAEEMKTDQNMIEAKENLGALCQSMTILINIPLTDSSKLPTVPLGGYPAKGTDSNRPELKGFETQKALLDEKHLLTNKAALPILTVSGDGNYGRPGYNFMDQNFRFYGIAGINLKWNIGALYNLNVEKQNLNINRQMVDVQKEVFELNLKTTLATETAQVNTLKSVIEKDKSIIEKRHNITLTASNQLQNGSITTTDYLTQLNAELQAVLNQKIHEIKLMNAISSFNTSKGL